jgi:hypothetical protein
VISALGPKLKLLNAAGSVAMGAGALPSDPTGVMALGVPLAVTPAAVGAAEASAASWLNDSRSCCAIVCPAAAVAAAIGCMTMSVRRAVDMSRLGVAGATGGKAPLVVVSKGVMAPADSTDQNAAGARQARATNHGAGSAPQLAWIPEQANTCDCTNAAASCSCLPVSARMSAERRSK